MIEHGPHKTAITLEVNGLPQFVDVEPRRTLLDTLRIDLGLTGAKLVCNMGNCGACTVLVDGVAVYSCLTLAVECEGKAITTIEGLAQDGVLHPLQQAFVQHDALQCGFCTPGQVLAAHALLARNPQPTEADVVAGMAGNLCRCGAYRGIIEAVLSAAQQTGPQQ
ncbi:MAG: (2Fe-2S)-binding protein [Chloroflexota bacterium]|nr:(2Fe-2S)-binding protein [Chloroflexota bacterium]PLS78103.1 MAG: (2Fe-2S)-binding protein [Chloroflexota bacterium]